MILKRLKIKNFRNLNGDFSLSSKQNLLIAPNGAGKTNFLEAIGFLSSGKSFRTSSESNVIDKTLQNKDFTFARISSQIENSLGKDAPREVTIEEIESEKGVRTRKSLKIDSIKKTLSEFSKGFYSTIFSPNTINLVINSPSVRRRDVDEFICSIYDGFYEVLSEYRKIIRNRNKLLEELGFNGSKSQLAFWNSKLVELGAVIIHQRLKAIENLNPNVEKLASVTFNSNIDSIHLKYISKFVQKTDLASIRTALEKKIKQNVAKEMAAGRSLYGPHREDFVFLFNEDERLDGFGSRGQQRLASFCYKLAQNKVMEDKLSNKPILLLDDLFSELDSDVRKKVCKYLMDYKGQLVLTALDEGELPDSFIQKAEIITIV